MPFKKNYGMFSTLPLLITLMIHMFCYFTNLVYSPHKPLSVNSPFILSKVNIPHSLKECDLIFEISLKYSLAKPEKIDVFQSQLDASGELKIYNFWGVLLFSSSSA